MIEINRNPSLSELRQFGLLWLPLFFIVAAGLFWFRWQAPLPALIASGAAVLSWAVTAAAPQRMRPVYVGWMRAAYPVGWLIAHLLLSVIYFVILTPIGLVMRLSGRDALQRRFDRGAASYWTPRPTQATMKSYFRQF
ncbi:MAG: SxtJ family membrane protein [Acidobacteriota bacterium]